MRCLRFLTVLAMCSLGLLTAGSLHAQCPDYATFSGTAASEFLGISVSGAGDVDNDGYADVIVGASGSDAGGLDAGEAFVYSGLTGGVLYTFTGEAAGDEFGRSVAGAGDVNSDGFMDLIVGAYRNDAGGVDAGRAYVFSGSTGAVLHTFTGATVSDWFGASVGGAGDVNLDGYADVIIGAPKNDDAGGDAGQAYIYSGLDGSLLYSPLGAAGGDLFGGAVNGAGDVNNDGFADVIIGATENDAGGNAAGRVYVYSGQTGANIWTVTGAVGGDRLGYSVDGVGDVNSDGFGDFVAGAPQNNTGGADAGQAYVYSGKTGAILHTFTGEAAGDWFGVSVAGAGDVNADFIPDVIVGAKFNDDAGLDAGKAYVYWGSTGAYMYSVLGEQTLDEFGFSVDGAGDVNSDGFADLLVGGYLHDAAGDDAGRAYIFNCLDTDHDGVVDDFDNCPEVYNPSQADADGDGRGDVCDNCPSVSNPDQLDTDLDNLGDACDPCPLDPLNDQDGDGVCGDVDNCPTIANPTQLNTDLDALGDACDPDDDNDGIIDVNDNCPTLSNPGQENADSDATGDACDLCTDTDGDGYGDPGYPANTCPTDNCPSIANPTQSDIDNDGIGDVCDACPTDPLNDQDGDGLCADADNCPAVFNPGQENADGDASGDACDLCTDTDGDGFGDPGYPANTCPTDNCPSVANPAQADLDNDGIGDICDVCPADPQNDEDGDGFCADIDNCPTVFNPSQANADADAMGDVCDPDDDNDGVADLTDNCPLISNPGQEDTDQDGLGDACDPCICQYQSDFDQDSFLTALDLSALIDILFAGQPDVQDPSCPVPRADFDCDGFSTALDLGGLIDHLFAGGAGPCDPCAP